MINENKLALWHINGSITSFDEEGANAFMSNFYPSGIVLWINGYGFQEFPTVEHAYQWHKPRSLRQRVEIQEAEAPGKAKKLGRSCLMVQDWEDIKVDVMRSCLLAKFSNPYLFKLLINTGDTQLIEGNTWNDTFWGAVAMSGYKQLYQGANVLGQLLMKIRDIR